MYGFSKAYEDPLGNFCLTRGMPHAYTSTGSGEDQWARYIIFTISEITRKSGAGEHCAIVKSLNLL